MLCIYFFRIKVKVQLVNRYYLHLRIMVIFIVHLIACFMKTNGELNNFTTRHINYLQFNGYLPKFDGTFSGRAFTNDELVNALKKFQEFAGLPITGTFDLNTSKKFNQPRCGMEDHISSLRTKRYVLQGGKWHKKVLTYRILNYSNDLSRDQIYKTIKGAFRKWEIASKLKFIEQLQGEVDIMIKFTRSSHGDPYPFDGPGGTLAHAFYPGSHELSGDIHFDDDELFTLNTIEGKDLSWVALHELGHSLGLEHSYEKSAIMYPWYERHDGRDIILNDDDKKGIQYLYGIPDSTISTDNLPTKVLNQPSSCIEKVDAITMDHRGYVVVVSKGFVYTYDNRLSLAEQPVSIDKKFNGVKQIDASFTNRNGRIVFIHGDRFWEYNGDHLVKGPSHTSKIGFTNDMVHLDGAVRWQLSGKIYFFKGNKYWGFDEKRYRVEPGYPKLIKDFWIGVPDNIDGVFEWSNRNLYFFKGLRYYRFDKKRFAVVDGYPLPFQDKFFQCSGKLSSGFYTSSSWHLQTDLFQITFIWLILHLN